MEKPVSKDRFIRIKGRGLNFLLLIASATDSRFCNLQHSRSQNSPEIPTASTNGG